MKKTPEPEKPRALTSYTIVLDDAQQEKLRAWCERRLWEHHQPPYARFGYRGPEVNIVVYTSGKGVIQGRGTEEFITHVLEPEITGDPRLGYDEVHHPEWFELHAGLDESGKGDFFGPLVTACVVADRPQVEAWLKAGIRDSKKIGDNEILKLDKLIRDTKDTAVACATCSMPKYNELMARPRANLNLFLAWLHAKSLEEALAKRKAPWGLLDQFSKQNLVGRYFKDAAFDLRMRTRAEEDPVVAAASVVARAEYVRRMKALSKRFDIELTKGAGPKVSAEARQIIERHGTSALREIAKLHFRTAYEVVSAAGKLDELPLPPPKARTPFR
ncbi:MAG: ribonuclease HIII [Puniceicoccaceae bacterium]|nr:MAG: ribonuclease HIII [Puniceicoccaceae bacterium]